MRLFFSMFMTFFFCVSSFAVTTVNICVTDKDGNPVPNAKVEVKGVVQRDKDDFCKAYGVDFHECIELNGINFDSYYCEEDSFPEFGDEIIDDDEEQSASSSTNWCRAELIKIVHGCGYLEDLDTWVAQMHKNEGRFKYEDININVNTNAKGVARIEVDGYAEYRVSVQGAVRYFKDGVRNINTTVKIGEEIYSVMPIDAYYFGGHPARDNWTIYVVKSNPYLDIREHFPNNHTQLQPEDILRYYPEIHDIRVWNEESYDKELLTFRGDFNESLRFVGQKERSLFLHLEQGEYQFIFTSDEGDIFIDELNTRTASNSYARFMWEKLPDDRWLLHFYVRYNPDYQAKTPPDYIQIPTVITPYTQDGVNDNFMPGYEVEIFDCYGNFVCVSPNGWDGYKGSELVPPGVYYYKVRLKDGRKRKGTVEVIKM